MLAEADKIKNKHLLTLEGAISRNQTDEMEAKKLQLVVPLSLHESYSDHQRKWLMPASEFTKLVAAR